MNLSSDGLITDQLPNRSQKRADDYAHANRSRWGDGEASNSSYISGIEKIPRQASGVDVHEIHNDGAGVREERRIISSVEAIGPRVVIPRDVKSRTHGTAVDLAVAAYSIPDMPNERAPAIIRVERPICHGQTTALESGVKVMP